MYSKKEMHIILGLLVEISEQLKHPVPTSTIESDINWWLYDCHWCNTLIAINMNELFLEKINKH